MLENKINKKKLNKSSVIVACGHIVKLFLLLSDYKYHTQV